MVIDNGDDESDAGDTVFIRISAQTWIIAHLK